MLKSFWLKSLIKSTFIATRKGKKFNAINYFTKIVTATGSINKIIPVDIALVSLSDFDIIEMFFFKQFLIFKVISRITIWIFWTK